MPKAAQTVKIDENALARAITKAMKNAGRNGDTELAHVNEGEKEMLKAKGGAGTKNPKTGLREYYDTDLGGVATDAAMGGFGDAAAGAAGTAAGVGGSTSDASATGGTSYTAPEMDPAFLGGDPKAPPGSPGGSLGAGSRSGGLGGLIESIINANKPSVLSPTSRISYELARGLGNYVGEPLDRALGGRVSRGEATGEEAQFSGGQMGPEGRNDALSQAMGVQPAVQQAPAFMRPAEAELPASLGLPTGLSDLQKRTLISTYGTQGAQSQYRTPEAMRAYGNLIARALIGDNNQVVGNETGTLPIEDQYLRQAFGINKPNSATALLEALRPYWSA